MKKKKARFVFASLLIVSILCSMCLTALSEQPLLPLSRKVSDPEKPLKWVEFNVPYEPLKQAMDIDVDSYQDRIHVSWIDLLAYLGARYGGDFSQYQDSHMDDFAVKIDPDLCRVVFGVFIKDQLHPQVEVRCVDVVGVLPQAVAGLPGVSDDVSSGDGGSDVQI